jgi:hypothetical protein
MGPQMKTRFKPGIIIFLPALMLLSFCFHSCKDKEPDEWLPPPQPVYLKVHFVHSFNGSDLIPDTMIYQNLSGNHIKVTDLQYFISRLTLIYADGSTYTLTSNDKIHYTDIDLPQTLVWQTTDLKPEGTVDSISFIFGLNEQDNISNRFPNPPERDMFWPEILGGGYHYMKMNLMWKDDTMPDAMPYNFHLGIGQIYSTPEPNPDSITGYVQNFFEVRANLEPHGIYQGETNDLYIEMNIEKWFDGPVTINLATTPVMMQNQQAMHNACLNGKEAFTAWLATH